MIPGRDDDPYIAWRPPFPEPDIRPGQAALLIVDMQRHSAHPDGATLRKVRAAGFPDVADQFCERLATIVPNIQRLQTGFRDAGLEVIHVRIASMTADGRDRGPSHKKLGHVAAPDSRDAEILAELAPVGDELVFSKTAGSVFCATNIEYVLRNLGITTLIVTGIVTTGCVHTAVTDAADRGFHVILVEDGCGALVPEMHWASIRILRDVYAKIMTTDAALDRVRALQDRMAPKVEAAR
ncbi:MAG TPA: isochorismatase family cysteine hydrolase [Thermomicrobiales bacterium]|nr:isochorismatase family cysteine hydrolase [Thermomicrobiales bacterium]